MSNLWKIHYRTFSFSAYNELLFSLLGESTATKNTVHKKSGQVDLNKSNSLGKILLCQFKSCLIALTVSKARDDSFSRRVLRAQWKKIITSISLKEQFKTCSINLCSQILSHSNSFSSVRCNLSQLQSASSAEKIKVLLLSVMYLHFCSWPVQVARLNHFPGKDRIGTRDYILRKRLRQAFQPRNLICHRFWNYN